MFCVKFKIVCIRGLEYNQGSCRIFRSACMIFRRANKINDLTIQMCCNSFLVFYISLWYFPLGILLGRTFGFIGKCGFILSYKCRSYLAGLACKPYLKLCWLLSHTTYGLNEINHVTLTYKVFSTRCNGKWSHPATWGHIDLLLEYITYDYR